MGQVGPRVAAGPNREATRYGCLALVGSVEEVAGAGEVHGDAGFGGGFDGCFVADGAAGLDDCLDAAFDQDLEAVGEGEEGVGGGNGADGAVAGPGDGEAAGVDAVDLTHADADRSAVGREQDRVRLHRATCLPGEGQVDEHLG